MDMTVASRRTLPTLVVSTLVLLSGCFGGQYTPTNYYAIAPEVSVDAAASAGLSLAVQALDYVRIYKERMVYRDGEHRMGYHELDRWAELPRDAVTRSLVDALALSKRFTDVGYTHEVPRPDLILTGEIREFDEIRTTEPWIARCSIHLLLRERAGETFLWSETLTATRELETKDADGLAAAMGGALADVIAEATRKIAAHSGDTTK